MPFHSKNCSIPLPSLSINRKGRVDRSVERECESGGFRLRDRSGFLLPFGQESRGDGGKKEKEKEEGSWGFFWDKNRGRNATERGGERGREKSDGFSGLVAEKKHKAFLIRESWQRQENKGGRERKYICWEPVEDRVKTEREESVI